MCKHCAHLGETPEEKKLVHDFMALLTSIVNRKVAELDKKSRSEVDDVEFTVYVPNQDLRPDLDLEKQPKVIRLLYRNLIQPFRDG